MGLFDIFSSSGGQRAANQAYRSQIQGIKKGVEATNAGKTEALGYLGAGQEGALGAYQPLQQAGQQGMDAYWNLLQNPDSIYDSELYKSREAAGIDALNRGANSRGMLASGNNTQDILDYMRRGGIDYFNTLRSAYSPYFDVGSEAARGMSNAYMNTAANQSNVTTGAANNLTNLYGAQGQFGADRAMNRYNADQAVSGNFWNAILESGKAAASAYGASDARVKTDIEQVGTLDNGLPVYLFRYKAGGPFQIGVMAQDVERVKPEAVVEFNGVKHVAYADAVR